MKGSLGDKNMAVLRGLRESLISDSSSKTEKVAEKNKWDDFSSIADSIKESVEDQDLTSLVTNVRKMKNVLRRPSVKKVLAQLEAVDKKDKDKKPEGNCKCAQCGKTIDGYRECVDGALCPDCAMKSRKSPPGEKEDQKASKKAKKGVAFPPEMIGMGGMGQEQGAPGQPPGAAQGGDPDDTDKDEKPEPDMKVAKKKKKKKKKFDDEENDSSFKREKKKAKTESRLRRRRVTFDENF